MNGLKMRIDDTNLEFAQNPYYIEYESLLIRLSHAMAEGDEETADRMRQTMEGPERWLNTAEIVRLNGLSADLYMLSNDERYEPHDYSQDQLRHLLSDAWRRRDAESTLALLRKGPEFLAPDRVAYLRSQAYGELGHTTPSLLFMRHAAHLQPQNTAYKAFVLEQLVRVGRVPEAVAEAIGYLQRHDTPMELLVQSAGILFISTQEMPAEQAHPLLEQCSQALQEAVGRKALGLDPAVVVQAYITLGSCYELLGSREAAVAAYDYALSIDDNNDAALILRGQLRTDTDPSGARQDFERAVQLRTSFLSPYLILARDALIEEDYNRCLLLCNSILSLTKLPRARAAALEFTAIAQLKLGAPYDMAQSIFERALTLDPLNERMRDNYQRLQEEHNGKVSVPSERWQYGTLAEYRASQQYGEFARASVVA